MTGKYKGTQLTLRVMADPISIMENMFRCFAELLLWPSEIQPITLLPSYLPTQIHILCAFHAMLWQNINARNFILVVKLLPTLQAYDLPVPF